MSKVSNNGKTSPLSVIHGGRESKLTTNESVAPSEYSAGDGALETPMSKRGCEIKYREEDTVLTEV
jgi:hypothetical protein